MIQKIVFITVLFANFASIETTWNAIFHLIQSEYPENREITIEELKAKMDQGEKIELFDVRESEEFQVSHIKGARNIKNAQDIAKSVKDKTALIICYCSVGYRSGKVTNDLMQLGFHNTVNLRGSIFKWVNKGNPVYRNGEKTSFIHPYNKKWGKLLTKGIHQYSPEP